MRNHDQFFLKPFQIDNQSLANKFDIVCKLAACKEGSWTAQNGACWLGNTCNSRYDIFNQSGRRRRQADTNDVIEEDTQQVWLYNNSLRKEKNKIATVTMEGVHPCMYVTEDINVCILDEGETPNKNNCWNEQQPCVLGNHHEWRSRSWACIKYLQTVHVTLSLWQSRKPGLVWVLG